MYIRPKLKDITNLILSFFETAPHGSYCFLSITETGGFELLRYYTEGSAEIVNSGNLRKSVRKALDEAEKLLHERRRKYNPVKNASEEE